jgi:putative phosphoribosyl transferase
MLKVVLCLVNAYRSRYPYLVKRALRWVSTINTTASIEGRECVVMEQNVQVPIKDNEQEHRHHMVLDGILTIPEQEKNPKKAIVVFAHGSGSGRHSPRNQYVASILNDESSISTLLVDLLTEREQTIDEKTREYRFNIKLLANRLADITDWLLTKNPKTQNTTIGYFGASTGAAAALMLAAEPPAGAADAVKAIVSRGGRPDLAGSTYLKQVQASTLLIVGSIDNTQVIAINQKALKELKNAREKRLVMIPGAGHLFEEPGTLEEATRHAASWFERYLIFSD